ncbi:MAG: YegS/Rv2252/BmrU family lipid kinase [Clostridiales bacterium]|nr:YegS/Rv2252/BmrU family lipid kinase [Clostridiales bacterium]
MKCLFVYNPISGKGKVGKKQKYIEKKLRERFGEVDCYATQKAGELTEKAREACGKYDVLIFAGGDGSFNEVVRGLGEHENRPILGYIPSGTVNDIARSTRIPRSIGGALKTICTGSVYPLDVMKINDTYVMYVCCSGGLTDCSYKAEQKEKQIVGKLAYVNEVIRHSLVFDEYPVSFKGIDGKPIAHKHENKDAQAVMVMIMNSRSVASMWINPDAKMDDGEAEVLIVRDSPKSNETSRHRHVRYFLSALHMFTRGFRRMSKDPRMYAYKGKEFTVEVPENIVWNFDGEQGTSGNIHVQVLNKHINMILPSVAKDKKSCLAGGAETPSVAWESFAALQAQADAEPDSKGKGDTVQSETEQSEV